MYSGFMKGSFRADNLHIVMSQGSAESEAADAAKAIDTDLGEHSQRLLSIFTTLKRPKNRLRKRLFFAYIHLIMDGKKLAISILHNILQTNLGKLARDLIKIDHEAKRLEEKGEKGLDDI